MYLDPLNFWICSRSGNTFVRSATVCWLTRRASTHILRGLLSLITNVRGFTYSENDSSNMSPFNIIWICSLTRPLSANGIGLVLPLGGTPPSTVNSYSNWLHLPGRLVRWGKYLRHFPAGHFGPRGICQLLGAQSEHLRHFFVLLVGRLAWTLIIACGSFLHGHSPA
jgi:hypothetical protein